MNSTNHHRTNSDADLQTRKITNVGSNRLMIIQDPTKLDYVMSWGKIPIIPKNLNPLDSYRIPHGYFIVTSDDGKDCHIKTDL